MVLGFESFKKWFEGFDDQYVIIGGVACDILMTEEQLDFRTTKDIDMVLLVESLTPDFGRRFWDYVREGEYQHKNKSSGEPQYYRFIEPGKPDFPRMIELFSRRLDSMKLPADAVLTPIPMDEDLSSLSAILMDDDYYRFLQTGRTIIEGVPVLSATHLIPLKVKAWLDLSARKTAGEKVDSKDISKHKKDVFRLTQLLSTTTMMESSVGIRADMVKFCSAMDIEPVDMKAIGVQISKDLALEQLRRSYL